MNSKELKENKDALLKALALIEAEEKKKPIWMKHPKQKGKAPFKVQPNLIDAYKKTGFVECEAPKKKEEAKPKPPGVAELKKTLEDAGVPIQPDWKKEDLIAQVNLL